MQLRDDRARLRVMSPRAQSICTPATVQFGMTVSWRNPKLYQPKQDRARVPCLELVLGLGFPGVTGRAFFSAIASCRYWIAVVSVRASPNLAALRGTCSNHRRTGNVALKAQYAAPVEVLPVLRQLDRDDFACLERRLLRSAWPGGTRLRATTAANGDRRMPVEFRNHQSFGSILFWRFRPALVRGWRIFSILQHQTRGLVITDQHRLWYLRTCMTIFSSFPCPCCSRFVTNARRSTPEATSSIRPE